MADTNNSASNKELLYEIEKLQERQVLVLSKLGQTVIDGLSSEWPPSSSVWKCKGGGTAFALCTKGIVDSNGCAIVVKHGDGYCSKPCRG